MSYQINEAVVERQDMIDTALHTRDSEMLYHLAQFEKEEGDDETAEHLLAIAKRIDREDNAYDESIGN